MILADTVKVLTTMKPNMLSKVLGASGYKDCAFKSSEFVGITNGGEFAYKVAYFDNNLGKDALGKVFVKYNNQNHAITADF